MKKALLISFILHALVLLSLYLPSSKDQNSFSTTSIDLISANSTPKKTQRARRKEKNANAYLKDKTKKTLQESTSLSGRDSVDVKRIRGSSNISSHSNVSTYAQALLHYIEKNRFYPRRALLMEQTGTVTLRLKINTDGTFTSFEIIKASSFDILNQAAVDLVTQLKSFKPLPENYKGNGRFIIPIDYYINGVSI